MKPDKKEKTKKQKLLRRSSITFIVSITCLLVLQILMIVLCFFISSEWFYRIWDALTYIDVVFVLVSFVVLVIGLYMPEEEK